MKAAKLITQRRVMVDPLYEVGDAARTKGEACVFLPR
jgi:hypothetical protein